MRNDPSAIYEFYVERLGDACNDGDLHVGERGGELQQALGDYVVQNLTPVATREFDEYVKHSTPLYKRSDLDRAWQAAVVPLLRTN